MKGIPRLVVMAGLALSCIALGNSPLAAAQTAGGAAPLPGTRAAASSTIEGSAVTAANGSLGSTLIRLRDARGGGIVSTATSDKSGQFSFRAIGPGSYVVEITGNRASVFATSQVVSVGAGEVAATVVRMPLSIAAAAGGTGQATSSAASETVVAAAASTGVLTRGPLDVCVSGPC